MSHTLINLAGFQVGWFACILGAAYGRPLVGVVVVVALVLGNVAWGRPGVRRGLLVLLAITAVLGYVMDSALVVGGALAFPETARLGGPSPLWMVALWLNLAVTLPVSMRWLAGRSWLSAVIGAGAGPVSYAAGARLGAATLGVAPAASLVAIAVEWLVAMPLLVWLTTRLVPGGLVRSRGETP